jgi:hypothetical protein
MLPRTSRTRKGCIATGESAPGAGERSTTAARQAFRKATGREERAAVTWYTLLIAVMAVVAFAAVTGIKPKGTRPVARTGLMTGARVALAIFVLLLLYLAYRWG